MQCMYCGAQIADGQQFCPNCNAALPVEAPGVASGSTVQQAGQPYAGQQMPPQQPGYQQQGYQQGYQQPYNQAQPAYAQQAPQVNDSGSIGWAILSFFIPIVGLILFLVWRTTKPKTAKVAGIGALIGFCLNLAYMVSAAACTPLSVRESLRRNGASPNSIGEALFNL